MWYLPPLKWPCNGSGPLNMVCMDPQQTLCLWARHFGLLYKTADGPYMHVILIFFGLDQGELVYPVHHMVLETTSWNQGSEPSGATMIPKMTVVADLTHSERIS